MENKIVMIEIERLHAHPKNPRKNIGDVTELSESIKKNGILQNLTVVPYENEITGEKCEGDYTVVIGHRRMAAAKAAGLTELPCAIKEMSKAEQLATMLAENIQRSELTPLEQAEGIQMMFDIGESVADVSIKTGLSESTVRRRAKLLEMNPEKLRETEGRGATLADYEKLSQIDDIKIRNKVLESIGTNNFGMELKTALDTQKKENNKKLLHAELDKFAKKVTNFPSGYMWECSYNYMSYDGNFTPPKDAEKEEYVYYPNGYGVALYKKLETKSATPHKEHKETAAEKKQREAREKENARVEAVKELAERAYNLRKKFIEDFNPAPRHGKEIKRFLWNMLCFGENNFDESDIDDLCGTKLNDVDTYEEKSSLVDEYFDAQPEKAMLNAAYLVSGDDKYGYIYYWHGEYCEEYANVDKLYECLERLGYQMSDEEKKLQDGTHELFKKE